MRMSGRDLGTENGPYVSPLVLSIDSIDGASGSQLTISKALKYL